METFEMVAKTLKGLEQVLAEELRDLGAQQVEPGRRMVAFVGDKAMLYRANLCCRTALRILKPFWSFEASTPDELYDMAKEYDWSRILTADKTFCIDTVSNSDEFTHSQYVTYKVKDAIVDWFRDNYGNDCRPSVRLREADVMINVHISGKRITLSLDSSGESLHKRGYKVAQTEAPINEVLAAGILLMSGYRGETPLVDPMCGSGTFLIEGAMIAANIMPGVYRKSFAFESWPDFDRELFESIYNDDSAERIPAMPIVGADISPRAIEIATENAKSAGVAKYITFETKPLAHWETAPQPAGILVTNPPYGERISAPDMEGLYALLGSKLKNVFQGYHAWIIGYRDEYMRNIGLAPSQSIDLNNGQLECQLKEYIIFAGDKKSFLKSGGKLKDKRDDKPVRTDRRDSRGRTDDRKPRRPWRDEPASKRDGNKPGNRDERPFKKYDRDERPGKREERPFKRYDRDERPGKRYDRDERPSAPDAEPENPFAIRRNPAALKMLQGKQPTLPPTPMMRKRKKSEE